MGHGTGKIERIIAGCLVGWAALSIVVGRLITALTPGSRDAQLFAYMGLQWTRGHLPYVEVWDNKPPGIFAVTAVSTMLFGPSFRVLAVMEGLSIAMMLTFFYLLLRRWDFDRIVALVAVAACAIGVNLAFYNQGGHLTEIYLLMPATLSMYLFARSDCGRRKGFVAAAGFSAGLASLIKPVGLAPLLAQCCFMLLMAAWFRRVEWKRMFAAVSLGVAGLVLAWIPPVLYFARYGAAWALIDASIFYNFSYGVNSGAKALGPVLLVVFLRPLSITCAFVVVALLLNARGLRRLEAAPDGLNLLLALLWLLFDVAGVLVGGRAYEHYYLVLVPSLTLTAAFGVRALAKRVSPEGNLRSRYVVGVVLLVPLLMTQLQDGLHWLRTRGENGDKPASEIAREIQRRNLPDAEVFAWPYRPQVLMESRASSVAPYPMAHHIYDSQRAYQEIGNRLLKQLREHPPAFAVDCAPRCVSAGKADPIYDEFRTFVQDNYEMTFATEGLVLYERKFVR